MVLHERGWEGLPRRDGGLGPCELGEEGLCVTHELLLEHCKLDGRLDS